MTWYPMPLLKAPFMLVVIALAARFVSRRFRGSSGERLGVGLASAALVLVADICVGVALRGLSVAESLFARDAIAGVAYHALLGVFALAPWA